MRKKPISSRKYKPRMTKHQKRIEEIRSDILSNIKFCIDISSKEIKSMSYDKLVITKKILESRLNIVNRNIEGKPYSDIYNENSIDEYIKERDMLNKKLDRLRISLKYYTEYRPYNINKKQLLKGVRRYNIENDIIE